MSPLSLVLNNDGISNLIDGLVATGYTNLYQAAVALQPLSNGVITDLYIATLAAQDSESEIFVNPLSQFTGFNNPVAINTDGTFMQCDINASDYHGQTGYTTVNGCLSVIGDIKYTGADSSDYYIYLGTTFKNAAKYAGISETNYSAFAIIWSTVRTLVLSNEGGLIDELVAAGYGNYSLYDTLMSLQPVSGGMITDGFLVTLKNCDADSEVFAATLSTFTTVTNNPVGINSDGTLIVFDIYGTDYYGDTGYKTYKADQAGVGRIRFTTPESADYYIDTGIFNIINWRDYYYEAVGIIWSK